MAICQEPCWNHSNSMIPNKGGDPWLVNMYVCMYRYGRYTYIYKDKIRILYGIPMDMHTIFTRDILGLQLTATNH